MFRASIRGARLVVDVESRFVYPSLLFILLPPSPPPPPPCLYLLDDDEKPGEREVNDALPKKRRKETQGEEGTMEQQLTRRDNSVATSGPFARTASAAAELARATRENESSSPARQRPKAVWPRTRRRRRRPRSPKRALAPASRQTSQRAAAAASSAAPTSSNRYRRSPLRGTTTSDCRPAKGEPSFPPSLLRCRRICKTS